MKILVDGCLVKNSLSLKIFLYSSDNDESNQYARQLFQEKVEAKNIETGTEILKDEVLNLFQLSENKVKCLIYKPPVECKL